MIYDHEHEADSRPGRSVADWGGDDLFTSMPRRRGKHTPARPRRVSGPATGSHATRRGPEAHRPARSEQPASIRMPEPLPLVPVEPAAPAPVEPPRAAQALRTPVRRRPQPTVEDRLASRPDRIAGWAFGLGITLILIAVGTADAGVI